MTVMKKIDEELKALNMEDQGKEPEPAVDADFEAAIEKAVNRRIKKIVFKTLAAVLACVVALTLCLNPLMNALLPNAKTMNEVTEDDVGNRVERTELEKLLSAYYEVSTPYVEIYTVDVDSKGFARYDITMYITSAIAGGGRESVTGTLSMKLGKLSIKDDPYHLINPMFGPFAWNEYYYGAGTDAEKAEELENLIEEIRKLPQSATLDMSIEAFDGVDVDDLRAQMTGSLQATWVQVEKGYAGSDGYDYLAGLNISDKATAYSREDMRSELSSEELVKPYLENLRTLKEYTKMYTDAMGLSYNNTLYYGNVHEILDTLIAEAETMEGITTKKYCITGSRDDIIKYLESGRVETACVDHVSYSMFG